MKAKSLVGLKFGRLTVISFHYDTRANKRWLCLGDCGKQHIAIGSKMVTGHTKSCGCLIGEASSRRAIHRQSNSPTYWSWGNMLRRCNDPKSIAFENYGGRGIKVCERWMKFENFYADMGEKPDGYSIDRINNDGNYEPSNCRWADRKTQNNNCRSNLIFTDKDGEVLTLSQLCEKRGKKYQNIKARFYRYGKDKQMLLDSL